jgi:predicted MarR family transcription regulator
MRGQMESRILIARESVKQAMSKVSAAHLATQIQPDCADIARALNCAYHALMAADFSLENATELTFTLLKKASEPSTPRACYQGGEPKGEGDA